jgi:imidazolonepropionase-like amidohydrolase
MRPLETRFTYSARLLVLTILSLVLACSRDGSESHAHVSLDARTSAITHVRVIDGTGRPLKKDQTIVIQDGRIREVGSATLVRPPSGASVVDGRDLTVLPGLVGMHEHLFYEIQTPGSKPRAVPAQETFAKLYLASGVTTIRTAGAVDFDGDLREKEAVDSGRLPGPKIHLTGTYLNAMSDEPSPRRIAQEVNAQAEHGATSFKAYTSLRSSELQAAIAIAHARGFQITGHLCAVGFREAAIMGIDNVEHGLLTDTEFYSHLKPDTCPDQTLVVQELVDRDVSTDPDIGRTIAALVQHHVAVTSTLAIFESFTGRASAFDPRMPSVLATRLHDTYETARSAVEDPNSALAQLWSAALTGEMQFERRFLAAGGLLMAGVDPTGWGGVLAGYGDQRELELLVESGLPPEAAVRVATLNGASFLREEGHIGAVAPGLQADLLLVRGNPSDRISDVRNVELVFKDGIAYDPDLLIASVQGTLGQYDWLRVARVYPFNLIAGVLVLLLVARRISNIMRQRREAEY